MTINWWLVFNVDSVGQRLCSYPASLYLSLFIPMVSTFICNRKLLAASVCGALAVHRLGHLCFIWLYSAINLVPLPSCQRQQHWAILWCRLLEYCEMKLAHNSLLAEIFSNLLFLLNQFKTRCKTWFDFDTVKHYSSFRNINRTAG